MKLVNGHKFFAKVSPAKLYAPIKFVEVASYGVCML